MTISHSETTIRNPQADNTRFRIAWIFSAKIDFIAFIFPSIAALLLVLLGGSAKFRHSPPWVFLLCVIAIDVAHVHTTLFRVYTDFAEVKRRPVLYFGAPVFMYLAGLSVHHLFGPIGFWRALAYFAVWHFVRQQVGWLHLYRAKAKEHLDSHHRMDEWLDHGTIYAVTVIPILDWHTKLPRSFHWFLKGDFVPGLSASFRPFFWAIYAIFLVLFAGRQCHLFLTRQGVNLGKLIHVFSTSLLWYVGIIAFNQDYVFTVTNVLPHGIPYFVIVFLYAKKRYGDTEAPKASFAQAIFRIGWPVAYAFVLLLALIEEGLFDRFVWHEYEAYFGEGTLLSASALAFLVPFLALPQGTHYLLDGFIWARKKNPQLARYL